MFWDKSDVELSVRESIEYFCGLGRVSPVANGTNDLQFGSVVFENDNPVAVVSLADFIDMPSSVLQHLGKTVANLRSFST
jgi:hypothetical protein